MTSPAARQLECPFASLVRGSLELASGFAMRVDASLAVGGAVEAITVSGQAPVVDPTTTRGGQTINTEMIVSVLPGSKTIADLVFADDGVEEHRRRRSRHIRAAAGQATCPVGPARHGTRLPSQRWVDKCPEVVPPHQYARR